MTVFEEAINEIDVEDRQNQRSALKESIKTRDRFEKKFLEAQKRVLDISSMTSKEYKESSIAKSRYGD